MAHVLARAGLGADSVDYVLCMDDRATAYVSGAAGGTLHGEQHVDRHYCPTVWKKRAKYIMLCVSLT